MAQPDDVRKTSITSAVIAPRPPNSPGSKTSPHNQHPQGDASTSSLSSNSSLKLKKNHSDDGHGNHHKKSVFTKVKEKARKLKKSLSGRKRREENDQRSPYSTPPGSAGPVDKRPGYFGSPSDTNIQSSKEQSREGSSQKHDIDQKKEEHSPSTGTGAPSKNEAGGSPETTDSKPSAAGISTRDATETATCDANDPAKTQQQQQDKGVSVKEYLMHKFEPGEDERALSQAITQTISPKCERMREAVNSLLGNEESSQSATKNSKTDPDGADSDQKIRASSSTESVDTKLTSLNAASDPSHGVESRASDASNISQCSASTTASGQNQNLKQS